jgi:hypothetical protein
LPESIGGSKSVPGNLIIALLLICLTSCSAGVEASRELSPHVRVVWLQDAGDGRDVFAVGTNLLMMAMDTRQAGRERRVMPSSGAFSRPLITSDGSKIVFTDRSDNMVKIVDWDGANLRILTSGFGLDLWKDPATGAEWLVFAEKAGELGARAELRRIRRINIAGDLRDSVLIWDKTAVGSDSFQLSTDGTKAGGLFPWPNASVADLPNGSLTRMGHGCWPSFAPGGIDILWVFDGAHRTVKMFPAEGEPWKVEVNNSAGLGGFEVYHPRWSNHPRFMVMTGPFKSGAGKNKIRGGGMDVEVYLGRFDDKLTRVESWTRLTDNKLGDFYPDVWVDDGGEWPVAIKSSSPSSVKKADPGSWRAVVQRDDLVFAWENSIIRAFRAPDSEAGRITVHGRAIYGWNGVMDVAGGWFEAEGMGEILSSLCRTGGQLSVECVITPAEGVASPDALILAFTPGGTQGDNFSFIQSGTSLVLRVRSGAGVTKTMMSAPLTALKPGIGCHVAICFGAGESAAYINGKRLTGVDLPLANFGSFADGRLIFGSGPGAGAGWTGTLENVVIYSRIIKPDETARRFAVWQEQLKLRTPPPRIVADVVLKSVTPEPSLEMIQPYRRAMVLHGYEVERVIQGVLPEKNIRVAHWAILDRTSLQRRWEIGAKYRLTIEAQDAHSELEGERQYDDTGDLDSTVYMDVGPR